MLSDNHTSGRNPTKHIWELGQVGTSWDELGQVGTTWDELGLLGATLNALETK